MLLGTACTAWCCLRRSLSLLTLGERDLLRPERVMIPAHVTILGTFCEVESLEFVYEQISGAMAGTDALNLVPTGDILSRQTA